MFFIQYVLINKLKKFLYYKIPNIIDNTVLKNPYLSNKSNISNHRVRILL